jgi:hypothetical protein
MGDYWDIFEVWVDTLSDGKGYFIKGRIMMGDNVVVFYLPFEPTIRDFSTILNNFRETYSVTDSFTFKTYIHPARYISDNERRTLLCNI